MINTWVDWWQIVAMVPFRLFVKFGHPAWVFFFRMGLKKPIRNWFWWGKLLILYCIYFEVFIWIICRCNELWLMTSANLWPPTHSKTKAEESYAKVVVPLFVNVWSPKLIMAVLRRINLLSLHDENPDVRHASSAPWNGREWSVWSIWFVGFSYVRGIENPI